MNARDLPGVGDLGNPFGYVPTNSPDFVDQANEKNEMIDSQIIAATEWLDRFAGAASDRNIKRMQQCRFLLVSCLVSIEGICSK